MTAAARGALVPPRRRTDSSSSGLDMRKFNILVHSGGESASRSLPLTYPLVSGQPCPSAGWRSLSWSLVGIGLFLVGSPFMMRSFVCLCLPAVPAPKTSSSWKCVRGFGPPCFGVLYLPFPFDLSFLLFSFFSIFSSTPLGSTFSASPPLHRESKSIALRSGRWRRHHRLLGLTDCPSSVSPVSWRA